MRLRPKLVTLRNLIAGWMGLNMGGVLYLHQIYSLGRLMTGSK